MEFGVIVPECSRRMAITTGTRGRGLLRSSEVGGWRRLSGNTKTANLFLLVEWALGVGVTLSIDRGSCVSAGTYALNGSWFIGM